MSLLDSKEIRELILDAFAERREVTALLKEAGLTWRDVVQYAKKDKDFRAELEEAKEAFAEGIFDELSNDISTIDEFNAAAKKAKLELAKYVLKILNPQKFIDKQELSVKHQAITPIIKISLAAPGGEPMLAGSNRKVIEGPEDE